MTGLEPSFASELAARLRLAEANAEAGRYRSVQHQLTPYFVGREPERLDLCHRLFASSPAAIGSSCRGQEDQECANGRGDGPSRTLGPILGPRAADPPPKSSDSSGATSDDKTEKPAFRLASDEW